MEPFRQVFYVGFYTAHALGAYAREGLDVELLTAPVPAQVTPSLLAGDCDVIWGGPMRILQDCDRLGATELVAFAEMVRRDPFILIGSQPRPQFRFQDLAGLRVAVANVAPTPELCLLDDIRRSGLDPALLTLRRDLSLPDACAALLAGEIDVVQAPEPLVDDLVARGAYIWSHGADRGDTAYTSLITTKAYASQHPDVVAGMSRAFAYTQACLRAESAASLARLVAPYFPHVAPDVLERAIGRYQALGLWSEAPELSVEGFVRLKCALISGGFITTDVPYAACVGRFRQPAEAAVN
jgi:NitT/TauT family transport system substrate-binding protein